MHSLSRAIMERHAVRARKQQKEAFRLALIQGLEQEGFPARVSQDNYLLKNANVVVGDVQSAKVILTAHYDTPRRMLLPANVMFPQNMVLALLYQLAWFLIPAGISTGVLFLLGSATDLSFFASYNISLACFIALSILLFFGMENKYNANDNTSGVVAVTETLTALPKELRKNVAAVFFDNEEWGLLGSAGFAKRYPGAQDKLVINLDCVGVGDEIYFLMGAKCRGDQALHQDIDASLLQEGTKRFCKVAKSGWFYPSDQINFRHGCAVAAFKRMPGIGLYLDCIHNHKDRFLDEQNIDIISRSLVNFIRAGAKRHG